MKYEELNDAQKAKARDWYRSTRDSDWYSVVYDDVIEVAKLLGIEIGTKMQRTVRGATIGSPAIYFSGFASQGDGACFEGRWQGYTGMLAKVKEYAPQDQVLHIIAGDLEANSAVYGHTLKATTKHSGHYYHSGCMDVDAFFFDAEGNQLDDWDGAMYEAEKLVAQALRCFANWIYAQLEAESDHQDEDAFIEEQIEANDYDFDVGTGGIRI